MADAHNRLQEINNGLFEELATDVYDEVDRRETDSCMCETAFVLLVVTILVQVGVVWMFLYARCVCMCGCLWSGSAYR